MKSIIILFVAILFAFYSCGGNTSNSSKTHTHEDGSVHDEHSDDKTAIPTKQESFKVEDDGSASKNDSLPTKETKHKHDHDHSTETGHKH